MVKKKKPTRFVSDVMVAETMNWNWSKDDGLFFRSSMVCREVHDRYWLSRLTKYMRAHISAHKPRLDWVGNHYMPYVLSRRGGSISLYPNGVKGKEVVEGLYTEFYKFLDQLPRGEINYLWFEEVNRNGN